MLTSYHAHTARIVDRHCDVILVGDSLGMVMHGLETTVPVTLDMMILQGHAVMRGSKRASSSSICRSAPTRPRRSRPSARPRACSRKPAAARSSSKAASVWPRRSAFSTERGVPVMAHVGLTPQSVNALGGFRAQGRDDSRMGADRGRCAGGRRCRGVSPWCSKPWPSRLAAKSPREIAIPTIGIGASAACDGQVLVLEDMLGLSPWVPKFVKRLRARPSIEAR